MLVRYVLVGACEGQDVGCRDAVGVLRLAGGALQGKAATTQRVWRYRHAAGIPERSPAPRAGSALRLSPVLPFKQPSLAVMARSHGDELRTGCLHLRELPGQGTAAAPGHIPSSLHRSKPHHWWDPPTVFVGRLALLSHHQPGCERGQVLAESVAVSSKAAGWCH